MATARPLASDALTSRRECCPDVRVALSCRSKYKTVGRLLARARGTLLDLGARDGALRRSLPDTIVYRSADIHPGCDFVVDLEHSLQFEDRSFDYVVALDVLEHVNDFHGAFHELLRVAREAAIVALPNMAFLPHRVSFALHGRLRTNKYDLGPAGPTDRHRWLTTSAQSETFMLSQADSGRLRLTTVIREAGGNRPSRLVSYALMRMGLPLAALLSDRTIFCFEKRPGLSPTQAGSQGH
jgi:hypothetical protein